MNQSLVDYVRSEIARGVREADIAAQLAIQGWSAETIQQVFLQLGYATETSTAYRQSPWFRRTSKSLRVGIAMCAVALLIAGFIVTVLAYRTTGRPHAVANRQTAIAVTPTIIKPERLMAATVTSFPCKNAPYPLPANTAHPLAEYPFPDSPVPYPQKYPAELRLPGIFQPVEVSGVPEEAPHFWTVKIRAAAPSCAVTEQLSSIFTTKGWHIETLDLGAGATFVTVTTQSADRSGQVTIDPERDNAQRTRAILQFSY